MVNPVLTKARAGFNGGYAPSAVLPSDRKRLLDEVTSQPDLQAMEESLSDLRQYLHSVVVELVKDSTFDQALTMKQAIERYARQLERFKQFRKEWQAFVFQYVRVDAKECDDNQIFEVNAALPTEVRAWQNELLSLLRLDVKTDESIVTASLVSKPFEVVKQSLANHLNECLEETSDAILSQLVLLVDEKILAVIEWFGKENCTYRTYGRNVSISIDTLQKEALIAKRKILGVKVPGKLKRTLSYRIHHLTNAISYPIGESKFLIPPTQQKFIASIPRWLLPFARIVEGTLIREIHVEQDLKTEECEFRFARNMTQWHRDPALVVGPFVLASWGPDEIQAEQARLDQLEFQSRESEAAMDQEERRTIAPVRMVGIAIMLAAWVLGLAQEPTGNIQKMGLCAAIIAAIILGGRWKSDKRNIGKKNGVPEPAPEACFGYSSLIAMFTVVSSFFLSYGKFAGGTAIAVLALICLFAYLNATRLWNPIAKPFLNDD